MPRGWEGPPRPSCAGHHRPGGDRGLRGGPLPRPTRESALCGPLDPPGQGHPQPVCGEQGLRWPLAFCCVGPVDGVAFAALVCSRAPLRRGCPQRGRAGLGASSRSTSGGSCLRKETVGAAWPETSACPRLGARFARLEQARLGIYSHLLPFKLLWANRRSTA